MASNIHDAFTWLETTKFTLANLWGTNRKYKQLILTPGMVITGERAEEIRTLFLNGVTAVQESAYKNKAEFERITKAYIDEICSTRYMSQVLDTMVKNIQATDPSFKWSLDLLVYPAKDGTTLCGKQIEDILKDRHYSDEEILPVLLNVLEQSSIPLYLVKQSLFGRGREIHKPLQLAAIIQYEAADTPIKRRTLHDIIDITTKFSMDRTAKEHAANVFPEALSLLDTIISLDVPITQAWAMVNTHSGEQRVTLPSEMVLD